MEAVATGFASNVGASGLGFMVRKLYESYRACAKYDANYELLHDFVTRVQPEVESLCADDNPNVRAWAQGVQRELETAEDLLMALSDKPRGACKRASQSKEMVGMKERVQEVFSVEAGLANLSLAAAVGREVAEGVRDLKQGVQFALAPDRMNQLPSLSMVMRSSATATTSFCGFPRGFRRDDGGRLARRVVRRRHRRRLRRGPL